MVYCGDIAIGGGAPVSIQSMTNVDTRDTDALVRQISMLADAGCEIVRCAIPDMEAAESFGRAKKMVKVPLVADIHFDHRLAIAAIDAGADKIRINPGNIGGEDRLVKVVAEAKKRDIPIRVGVNSGSLERELVDKYGGVTADGIVESALDKVGMIERAGYDNIVVSIKSSNVMMAVDAHKKLAPLCRYPLHVGITEAGSVVSGNLKSGVGIGIILYEGIGDTIRVSLTGDPVEEVKSARMILRSLGLRSGGIEVVSCPTCGRTSIDLISLVDRVEKMLEKYRDRSLKVAVMGCAVNGPGEAKEADIGVAGGVGEGLIFRKGEIIKKVKEEEILGALEDEIAKIVL